MQQDERGLVAATHDPVRHPAARNVDEAFRFDLRGGRRARSASEHTGEREAAAPQTNGHVRSLTQPEEMALDRQTRFTSIAS